MYYDSGGDVMRLNKALVSVSISFMIGIISIFAMVILSFGPVQLYIYPIIFIPIIYLGFTLYMYTRKDIIIYLITVVTMETVFIIYLISRSSSWYYIFSLAGFGLFNIYLVFRHFKYKKYISTDPLTKYYRV